MPISPSLSAARLASAALAGLFAPLAVGMAQGGYPEAPPVWNLEAELVSSDPLPNDRFGCSVSVDGDFLVAGACYHEHSGLSMAGAAYVFVRRDGAWIQMAKLVAPDAAADDIFGESVAISGDTIVIGAASDDHAGGVDAGSAHVFVRSGPNWVHRVKLVAPDAAPEDHFGCAVDVDGDTILVGATWDDHSGAVDAGAAYVFVPSGATWVQQAKLVSSRPEARARLGRRVSISGDRAAMSFRKSAHLFERQGSSWSERAILLPPTDLPSSWYGIDVAVSGETAAVMGRFRDAAIYYAVVYTLRGGGWVEQHRVGPYDCNGVDWNLALDGDALAVTMNGWETPTGVGGFVEVFPREGHEWGAPFPLNLGREPGFGMGLDVSKDLTVVGSPYRQRVYVYRKQ